MAHGHTVHIGPPTLAAGAFSCNSQQNNVNSRRSVFYSLLFNFPSRTDEISLRFDHMYEDPENFGPLTSAIPLPV